MNTSSTIYVGNTQSINDETLRDYFARFGQVEACFHNCTRAADEWLIDYRFIRFTSDTDMSVFLTNKIDHSICRILLDIQPYDSVFSDETRLVLDKKICVAHTDSKLDRNIVKKAFTKYGRVLNCTCVSSGNGVEYVYIEFDSINSVRSIIASGKRHFAGRTSLAVKQPLRPSQLGLKIENIPKTDESPIKTSRLILDSPSKNLTRRDMVVLDTASTLIEPTRFTTINISDSNLNQLEHEYDLEIRDDFDEITHRIDRFLSKQRKLYRTLHEFILNEQELTSSSSSDSEEENIDQVNKTHKRVKYHL